MAADRNATKRRATNDQKSIESMHRAGRLPAITGETVTTDQTIETEIKAKCRLVREAAEREGGAA
jgi:hypothetical protein